MNALAEFHIYLMLVLGPVAIGLALLVAVAEYAFAYRNEIKWCWHVARWLDSL